MLYGFSDEELDYRNESPEYRGKSHGKENQQPPMKNQREIHNNTFIKQKKLPKKKITR